MIEELFSSRRVFKRIKGNPFYPWLDDLASHLNALGFKRERAQAYLFCAEHFLRWLPQDKHKAGDFDESAVHRFLKDHLPSCSCPKPAPRHLITVRAALNHLIHALRQTGRLSPIKPTFSAAASILAEYDEHLRDTCGMAESTRHHRLRNAREFLEHTYKKNEIDLNALIPGHVLDYMSMRASGLKPGSVKAMGSSLRSFFRFLAVRHRIRMRLDRAVPSVPCWRLSSIPKTLPDEEIKKLIASFDRSTATGRRDYAIALCFTSYGLRTNEVASLSLDNVDWRAGAMTVVGKKTHSDRQLPLTAQVGAALAAYLRNGRPASRRRNLFLRHTVPAGAPMTCMMVRGVIRRAYARCGIVPPAAGPHVLRHSLATRLLETGASIKEIADILGHRSIESAAIYAKVNLPALREVCLPWPEATR